MPSNLGEPASTGQPEGVGRGCAPGSAATPTDAAGLEAAVIEAGADEDCAIDVMTEDMGTGG